MATPTAARLTSFAPQFRGTMDFHVEDDPDGNIIAFGGRPPEG